MFLEQHGYSSLSDGNLVEISKEVKYILKFL